MRGGGSGDSVTAAFLSVATVGTHLGRSHDVDSVLSLERKAKRELG